MIQSARCRCEPSALKRSTPVFLLGVGVAIAMAGSVWQRSTPLLVAGAIGLFGYLVGAIVYFLSDTVGVPIALLLSGVALLGVAVVTARLKRFTARA